VEAPEITLNLDPASLPKIAEGREAEVYALDHERVLRLLRDGSRAQLEGEFAAMQAGSGLQYVPRVFGVTETGGRAGMVMERLDGDDLLTLLGRQPWRMWEMGRLTGEVQARLHDVSLSPELPSVHDRVAAHIERAVPEHLRAHVRSLLSWLPDGDRACHLDFHPGNIMLTRRGPVVIDWPNARRGDPAADVARSLLILELGELPEGAPAALRVLQRIGRRIVLRSYARAYRRTAGAQPRNMHEWRVVVAADRLADGIPHERSKLLAIVERSMAAADTGTA
jgi:aminoglycoside phosphotransferase (APT) family kinase protein